MEDERNPGAWMRRLPLAAIAAVLVLAAVFADRGPEPFRLQTAVYEAEGELFSVVPKNGTLERDYAYIVQVLGFRPEGAAFRTYEAMFGEDAPERFMYATEETKVFVQRGAQLETLPLEALAVETGKRVTFRYALTDDDRFLVALEFRIARDNPHGDNPHGDEPAGTPPATDAVTAGGGAADEAGAAAEPPPLSEAEVRAQLEASFAAYRRIEAADGEALAGSIALLDERTAAYAVVKETPGAERFAYESTVYLLGLADGEAQPLDPPLPHRIERLEYDAGRGQLAAAYYDVEADGWKYAAWEAASGEAVDDPRIVLAENDAWELFRSSGGPGIWAAAKAGGTPLRISNYDRDGTPLFYPGEDRFLYQAHTGERIADGSGYGYALAEYDLGKGEGRELPYAIDGVLLGWSEPGVSVFVDQAFNEGESVDYADPRIVDVATLSERRLTDPSLDAYNMAYNEVTGEFVFQLEGYFVHNDASGGVRRVAPWAYEGGEIVEARPQPYSPDGAIRAYVARNGDGNRFAESSILADDASGRRVHAFGAQAFLAPLAWSADGTRYAVLADTGFGVYIGVQETAAVFGTAR